MQFFPPPQCVDEIVEDVPESDLLPKNMMKVPEVYSVYCQSSYRKRERGGDGEGGKRGGEGEEGVYIQCIVTMSLCLCSDVKKN